MQCLEDVYNKLNSYKREWLDSNKNAFYLYFEKDNNQYRLYVDKDYVGYEMLKKSKWEGFSHDHYDDEDYDTLYDGIIDYIESNEEV